MMSLGVFFKQKTADEMRISDWSSDVCSSDLQRMEPGRSGLLARNLPVARQHETRRRPKHLKAIVAAAEQLVEIEFGVAQKRVKRRTIDIPGRENQPAIQMHPRLLQPKLLLRALVPVHLLLLDRRPDEAAVRTKRPAMINAAMRLRIARLAKTHLHPAMRTHVQRYMNLALTITRH